MPISLTFDDQIGAFRCVFSELLEVADLKESDRLILESEHFCEGVKILNIVDIACDISVLSLDLFRTELLPILRETAEQRRMIAKIAWVIPSAMQEPIFNLWKSLPDVEDLQVLKTFSSLPKALEWLAD